MMKKKEKGKTSVNLWTFFSLLCDEEEEEEEEEEEKSGENMFVRMGDCNHVILHCTIIIIILLAVVLAVVLAVLVVVVVINNNNNTNDTVRQCNQSIQQFSTYNQCTLQLHTHSLQI